jgi:hypothetical protein
MPKMRIMVGVMKAQNGGIESDYSASVITPEWNTMKTDAVAYSKKLEI